MKQSSSAARRRIDKARLTGISGGLETLEPRQMMAADPVTPDNPLWVALPGTATIDGVLNETAWSSAFTLVRSQSFRDQSSATLKMMYGSTGLYVAFDVKDTNLWADGRGAGIAQRWEIETDDAMALYFDPNNSRDEYLQSGDRVFGVNTGNPEDLPINPFGNKLVKWAMGDGAGGAPDVVPGGTLATGLTWRTVRNGTVNNDNNVDIGWTTEMFLPWTALGMLNTGPSNGQTIGMNFQLFFDNNGRERDLTDYRTANGGADRWTKPAFIDDQIEGVHSSYAATNSGTHGPVNYAQLMFLDPAARSLPASITNLATSHTTGYSSTLTFTSPAGVSGTASSGSVSSYQVRYSTTPITSEAAWVSATKFEQRYVPRLAGLTESLRVIKLSPGTTYFVAVRGVDAAGNLGGLSNSLQITTQTTAQDVSGGQRLIPSPFGRNLMRENDEPFVAVGDHLGLSWNYTRNLYTGDVWNPTNSSYINFNTNPSFEGTAGPYFDTLASRGVNTMRVYLELQNVYFPPTNQRPRGTLWLESKKVGQATQFNPEMRQFMLNVLRQADAHNMSIIFSPFDSFSYDDAFSTEFPWSAANGGPLSSIDDFFQTPAVLTLAKARMDVVTGWLQSAEFKPYAHRLMGWEMLSEWDSYEWTLNAEGNNEPGRETEFRRRSQWIDQLAAYVKQRDPERLVLNSTIAQDPRGPAARVVFLSRNFDVLMPHLYTNANEEPVNNPDADRSIRAAVQNATLTTAWLNSTESRTPILNGEWGMTRAAWPGGVVSYGTNFTQAEDENLYRTMIWSGFASGQFGTSLRIPTEELNFSTGTNRTQGYILTDAMRNSQKTLSNFVGSNGVKIDFAHFNYSSLAGDLAVTSQAGKKLKSWGVGDRQQGIVYILQDTNQTTGNVTDGRVVISGLQADSIVDVEIWSTASGAVAPLSTVSGVFVSTGQLSFDLPAFAKDVAVKFKARAATGQAQRVTSVESGTNLVTFFFDQGSQPMARIQNTTTGAVTLQDISSIARFTGRVVDMDPFVLNGVVYLAVTDEDHHLWLFSGNTATAAWTVQDLTASINAPGLTGDLTHYIPSWGTIQIAGLDARGHAVNYFYQPGVSTAWQFSDLTVAFNGPIMKRGLTGYVAPWDGINFAGLNEAGEVIVYWWSLELLQTGWQTLNMTTLFNGPTFVNQLDAYVTPWGGLNIAGRTSAGELYTYWWAPGLGPWNVTSITQAAGAPLTSNGTEVAVSGDGGINLFSTDGGNALTVLRWKPADPIWRYTDISTSTTGKGIELPLGAAAVGNKMLVAGRASGSTKSLLVFTFDTVTNTWSGVDTGTAIEI